MANSTSPVPQVVEGTNAVGKINEVLDMASQAMIGGRNAATTSLLTWGYLGGRISSVDKASGTVALTASTTNYIVMEKSGLAVSVSTATTNWDDSTNYWRLYSVVTSATAATTWNDERFGTAGLFGVGGSGGGSGFTNPMTTIGDVIYGGAAGVATRLGIGTTAYVFTSNGAGVAPSWQAAAAGFANPMTTAGDLIYGGTAGVPTRLAIGSNTQVLTLSGGLPTWAASGGTFTGGTLTSALNEAPPATIASAATVAIGAAASNTVIVSGTTTITAFDTIAAGAIRNVRFSGALTLTHNATTLILPGAANITTAVGDVATVESLGSGNWSVQDYTRADGTAVVGVKVNSQSAAYTLLATDTNTCIYHPSADTTPRTWTIPANSSVPLPVGTVVTFDNDAGAGAITIAITTDTLVLVSVGSTGPRTLASGGQATAIKVTATRWRISGVGLS